MVVLHHTLLMVRKKLKRGTNFHLPFYTITSPRKNDIQGIRKVSTVHFFFSCTIIKITRVFCK